MVHGGIHIRTAMFLRLRATRLWYFSSFFVELTRQIVNPQLEAIMFREGQACHSPTEYHFKYQISGTSYGVWITRSCTWIHPQSPGLSYRSQHLPKVVQIHRIRTEIRPDLRPRSTNHWEIDGLECDLNLEMAEMETKTKNDNQNTNLHKALQPRIKPILL